MAETTKAREDQPRPKPLIWVTWIRGVLAGKDQCEFALWFKAHHKFQKRVEEGNDLTQWSAEHGAMVRARADVLRAQGWTVRLEDQNKFTVVGEVIDFGGTPDIVALKEGVVRFEDCKTGKRRDADYWQVVCYCVFAPMTDETLKNRTVEGMVVYADGAGERAISPEDIRRGRQMVVTKAREIGGMKAAPRAVPSSTECRFCDIASCPDRYEKGRKPGSAKTNLF